MEVVGNMCLYWYAIRTRSRHEKVVRDQLAGRGIEQLLPTFITINQWKDRRKAVQIPLFPGYCFARFSLQERLPVLQAPGVIDIVGQGNCPEPIPDRDVDAIKSLVSAKSHYDPYPYMPEGTPIEVIHGPFKGVRGSLVRKANQYRLVIAVHLIRQAASVEIDARDVVPILMSVS